jgi:hypothetical protein
MALFNNMAPMKKLVTNILIIIFIVVMSNWIRSQRIAMFAENSEIDCLSYQVVAITLYFSYQHVSIFSFPKMNIDIMNLLFSLSVD